MEETGDDAPAVVEGEMVALPPPTCPCKGSQGAFRAHTTPPVRLSNITALLPPPPPITKLIRNQEDTVMYLKERSGTQR